MNRAQIDFGDGAIDFGDSIDYGELNSGDVTLETGDIDWGDVDANDSSADIDFNVSIEDSGIKVEGSGLAGGVARGTEALTLLDSPQHRDQFLDEVFEVSILPNPLFPWTIVMKPLLLFCSSNRS